MTTLSLGRAAAARLTDRLGALAGGALCRGLAFGALAALIWGGYLAMARAGLTQHGLAPADIALLRYGVAGLLLAPVALAWTWRDWRAMGLGRLAILTLLAGPLFILLSVGGYRFAPLAHGAVIQPAAITATSLVLAMVVLGERLGRWQRIGIVIVAVAVSLITIPGLLHAATGESPWQGDIRFAASGAMWALFSLLAKRWKLDPLRVTAAVSVIAALVYVPIFLVTEEATRLAALSWPTLASHIVAQGVLSGVVAVIAFARAVQLLGLAKAALFPALVPVVGVAAGIPIAGEWPTLVQWGGVALAVAGLVVAVRR